jgi:hypothetical protein
MDPLHLESTSHCSETEGDQSDPAISHSHDRVQDCCVFPVLQAEDLSQMHSASDLIAHSLLPMDLDKVGRRGCLAIYQEELKKPPHLPEYAFVNAG